MRERQRIEKTFLLAGYINLTLRNVHRIKLFAQILSHCGIILFRYSIIVICDDPRILVYYEETCYILPHYITKAIGYLSDFSRMAIYCNFTEKKNDWNEN